VPGHEKLGAGIPHEPFRLPRCPKGRFAEVAALRKRCPAGSKATRARERWPQIERIDTRYRAGFAYVDTHLADGETLRLCRLRYTGYANEWGFAIYRASHDDYEDSILPNGLPYGPAEDALDTACGLYLNDPTAWT